MAYEIEIRNPANVYLVLEAHDLSTANNGAQAKMILQLHLYERDKIRLHLDYGLSGHCAKHIGKA